MNNPPVVLLFGGIDPTGGAGLAADVLTVASLGCHPAPVVTAATVQDTGNIKQFTMLATESVIAQARAVLEDVPVAAFKTGMIGTSAMVATIASVLDDYPKVPLVLDPVQFSNRGDALAEESLVDSLRALLVPRATLLTPNSLEARMLAPEADSLEACAQELMSLGADYVLITGTHEPGPMITHSLYGRLRLLETFQCHRLPNDYHGSGCTLASACAAALAHGLDPTAAVGKALRFTYQALKHGFRPGLGQVLPNRLFWATQDGSIEKH